MEEEQEEQKLDIEMLRTRNMTDFIDDPDA